MILKLMYLLLLAVPVCAVVLGFMCWRCPPKGPTWAYGYRSRRARASTESWLFAQNLAGQIWYFLGLVMLVGSFAVMTKLDMEQIEGAFYKASVVVIVQLVLVCLCQLPTEYLLLQRFDRFGRDREAAEEASEMQEMEYEQTAPMELPYEQEADPEAFDFHFDLCDDSEAAEPEESQDNF